MTEQLNREFTKFANSDPATFKPGVTYFVLSNLSGGAGTKCEPLKVQLKCIVGYAWNSSVIRRLNNGRSRAVTEIQHILAKMGVSYTSVEGIHLQGQDGTDDVGNLIVRKNWIEREKED